PGAGIAGEEALHHEPPLPVSCGEPNVAPMMVGPKVADPGAGQREQRRERFDLQPGVGAHAIAIEDAKIVGPGLEVVEEAIPDVFHDSPLPRSVHIRRQIGPVRFTMGTPVGKMDERTCEVCSLGGSDLPWVGKAGLEPARLSARDPKSRSSASSDTPPTRVTIPSAKSDGQSIAPGLLRP